MTNKKIGLLQFFCLIFFLSHLLFLFLGQSILKVSGNDTIFACLLGFLFNLFIMRGFLFFWSKHRSKTPKKTFNLFLALLFVGGAIFLLRESALFIEQNFLPQGNLFHILLLLFLLALMISKRKIPQVASLALLCFFLFVPVFVVEVLGTMNSLNIDFLKPPLVTGGFNVLKGALLFSLYTFLPLLLLFFLPQNQIDHKNRSHKYAYFALLLSNLVTIVQFFMIAFGPSIPLATLYNYPYMLVINQIASFLIFDRFSYLFSIFLLFDSTITLGLLFTLVKERIPKRKNYYTK